MLGVSKKAKLKPVLTPHSDLDYWKERIRKEIEAKRIRKSTISGNSSLMNDIMHLTSTNIPQQKEVFSSDLVHLFTGFISSKAKMHLQFLTPTPINATTAINWTRMHNGGHIPKSPNNPYPDLFARKSYLKPNQLKQDSADLSFLIDDIKTSPNNPYSRKKQQIAQVYKSQ